MASANVTQTPAWYAEYQSSWRAGEAHVIGFTGDLSGYTMTEAGAVATRKYLMRKLAAAERIVVAYDLATGVTFPADADRGDTTDRDEAKRLLGLDEIAKPKSNDPFAAALGKVSGAGAGSPAGQAPDPFEEARSPRAAMALVERLLRASRPQAGVGGVALILNYADLLLPASDKGTMPPDRATLLATLLTWANDATLAAQGNPVFLLATTLSDLHADLRAADSGIKMIEIPLPDRATRLAYLEWYFATKAERGKPVASELEPLAIANLTAGLSLRHLEDVLLLGIRAGAVTHDLVKARKDEIIRTTFTDIAETVEPLAGGFAALGGMEPLKDYFRTSVIDAMRRGSRRVAKGVLLVGPPGTGKTLIARAVATEARMNCVALNMSRILGGVVGASETNLRRFFGFVRALSPCVVFVDEIDQTDVSRRGQGSGNPVASNLFNQMLQFMSDETLRGKVVVIFASNRPDLLDDALLRFGRMDAIIPVLCPDLEERVAIVAAQARLQGVSVAEGAAEWLAQATDRYSGADLAGVVAKSVALAEREDRAALTLRDLERAHAFIRPNTPRIADAYTTLAVQACNDAEFLPEAYRDLLADRERLEEQATVARTRISNPGAASASASASDMRGERE